MLKGCFVPWGRGESRYTHVGNTVQCTGVPALKKTLMMVWGTLKHKSSSDLNTHDDLRHTETQVIIRAQYTWWSEAHWNTSHHQSSIHMMIWGTLKHKSSSELNTHDDLRHTETQVIIRAQYTWWSEAHWNTTSHHQTSIHMMIWGTLKQVIIRPQYTWWSEAHWNTSHHQSSIHMMIWGTLKHKSSSELNTHDDLRHTETQVIIRPQYTWWSEAHWNTSHHQTSIYMMIWGTLKQVIIRAQYTWWSEAHWNTSHHQSSIHMMIWGTLKHNKSSSDLNTHDDLRHTETQQVIIRPQYTWWSEAHWNKSSSELNTHDDLRHTETQVIIRAQYTWWSEAHWNKSSSDLNTHDDLRHTETQVIIRAQYTWWSVAHWNTTSHHQTSIHMMIWGTLKHKSSSELNTHDDLRHTETQVIIRAQYTWWSEAHWNTSHHQTSIHMMIWGTLKHKSSSELNTHDDLRHTETSHHQTSIYMMVWGTLKHKSSSDLNTHDDLRHTETQVIIRAQYTWWSEAHWNTSHHQSSIHMMIWGTLKHKSSSELNTHDDLRHTETQVIIRAQYTWWSEAHWNTTSHHQTSIHMMIWGTLKQVIIRPQYTWWSEAHWNTSHHQSSIHMMIWGTLKHKSSSELNTHDDLRHTETQVIIRPQYTWWSEAHWNTSHHQTSIYMMIWGTLKQVIIRAQYTWWSEAHWNTSHHQSSIHMMIWGTLKHNKSSSDLNTHDDLRHTETQQVIIRPQYTWWSEAHWNTSHHQTSIHMMIWGLRHTETQVIIRPQYTWWSEAHWNTSHHQTSIHIMIWGTLKQVIIRPQYTWWSEAHWNTSHHQTSIHMMIWGTLKHKSPSDLNTHDDLRHTETQVIIRPQYKWWSEAHWNTSHHQTSIHMMIWGTLKHKSSSDLNTHDDLRHTETQVIRPQYTWWSEAHWNTSHHQTSIHVMIWGTLKHKSSSDLNTHDDLRHTETQVIIRPQYTWWSEGWGTLKQDDIRPQYTRPFPGKDSFLFCRPCETVFGKVKCRDVKNTKF